jgi:hypothetical protein
MPIQLCCPECNKPLKVKDELAGKKVKCPGCGKPVPVPVPDEEPEPVVEEVQEAPAPKPAKAAVTAKAKAPPTVEAADDDDQPEEERAPKGKAGKKAKGGQQWVPCPNCGAEGARRVKYTFWGSVYGPRLFSHVRCQECRTTYNGKTGGSNIIPAIIGLFIQAMAGIVILLLLVFIGWGIWQIVSAK